MRQILRRLWNDDQGAIIAVEYLFFVTILIIGIIVGLTNVRDAINVELSETGNAFLALSQGYTISGASGCGSAVDGSQAIDTPGLLPAITLAAPSVPSVIDVQLPCN